MTKRILVIEDSEEIGLPLVRTLTREGYDVTWAESGAAGLAQLADAPVDLVILDLGLPDMDGLDVCQTARDRGFGGGILICTARGEELDRVVGLDHGADDYLPKPFGLAELHARVRALLRRTTPAVAGTSPAATTTATATTATATTAATATAPGGLSVDVAARRVVFEGGEIALTSKEFDVLAMLTRAPGTVVTREDLMAQVWDENWFGSTKTLDVTIGRLRQKLEAARVPDVVSTVRGVGFRLDRSTVDA